MNDQTSAVFEGDVGRTVSAVSLPVRNYLIDSARFPSEGNWAFCRFDSDDVPALRLGFQRGGFNGGFVERAPSRSYLQLHVELMTRDGAILWLPSGTYGAARVISDPNEMNIRFEGATRNIFSMQGWPTIDCHACSEDGDLEVQLQFSLETVVILPDSELPFCLFGMWESLGEVRGSVRYLQRLYEVKGKVFFDHTRVIAQTHSSVARHGYVYTTLYFEDGGGLFGYHSVDADGRSLDDYCFNVYLDGTGAGRLIRDVSLTGLTYDADGIAKSWLIACKASDLLLTAHICVRDTTILRCWGSASPPQSRKEFSIIPLVLDGSADIVEAGQVRRVWARGLAEYFNADLWPADKAASDGTPDAASGGNVSG